MKVKASLHLHSSEDYKDGDVISYSFFRLIDKAKEFDFNLLACTGHEKMVCLPEYIEYGKKKGIIIVPGVEALINGKHILILNCDDSADKIKTFSDLRFYKEKHPEIFVIAPHPNHGFLVSLGFKKLRKYIELFDAVEHSWFYSKWFNLNLKTIKIAKDLKLPLVSTSDLHDIRYLNSDYLIAEVENLIAEDFFKAIKNNNFINYTSPKFLPELISFQLSMIFKGILFKIIKFFKFFV